jgi:hypothetical protein
LDNFLSPRRAKLARLRVSRELANTSRADPDDTKAENSSVERIGCGEGFMAHEFNVLALVKGAERFVFVYDDASRDYLIDALRQLAGSIDSNLTWFDAMVLTEKAREQAADRAAPAEAADEWLLDT